MDKRGRSSFYLVLSVFLIFLFIIVFLSYTNKTSLTGNVIYNEVLGGDVIWKFTTPFYNIYNNTNENGYGFHLSLWNSSYSKASTEIYPDEIMSFNFSYQYSTSSPKSYNLLIKNSSEVLFKIFVNCNSFYRGRSGVYISGTNGEKLKTFYSNSVKNSYCDSSFFGGGLAKSISIDRTKGNLSVIVMNKNFLINDSSDEALKIELLFSKPKKDYDNVYVTNFFVGDKEFPFIAYPLNEQSYLSVSGEDIELSLMPTENKYSGGVVYYFVSLSEEDYLNSDFPSKGYGRLEPGEVYLLPANVKISESPDRSNEHFIMKTEYYSESEYEDIIKLKTLQSNELANQKENPLDVALTAEALYQQPDSISLNNAVVKVLFISSFESSSESMKDAGVVSFKKPEKTKLTSPKSTRPKKPTNSPDSLSGVSCGAGSGSSFAPPLCNPVDPWPNPLPEPIKGCIKDAIVYKPSELFFRMSMTKDELKWICKSRTIADTSGCNAEYEDGWWCNYDAHECGSTCTNCKKLQKNQCTGTDYTDYEEILVSRIPGVPINDVGCCVNTKKKYVDGKEVTTFTKRRPYDVNKYMCCPNGSIIELCETPKEGCKKSSEDYPGLIFTGLNIGGASSDGCCPLDKISCPVDTFLRNLAENLEKLKECKGQVPAITATQTGCHSLQSPHYTGCAVDVDNVKSECLKAASGYPVVSPPKGLWPSGKCYSEGSHYHCMVCKNYPPVIGEYEVEEK